MSGPEELLADPRGWMSMLGIRRDWVRDSLGLDSAAKMGQGLFAQHEWGAPVAAFIWSEEIWHDEWDCDSTVRAIGILYESGRVLDFRQNKRGNRISHYTSSDALKARAHAGGAHA